MTEYIGLDFETYGSVDLRTHGLDRYLADPHFRVLIACTFQDSGVAYFGRYDFVEDFEKARVELAKAIEGKTIVAHNAGFEHGVLAKLDIHVPVSRMIDSAVVARAAGGGSALAAAAPQLLGTDKMEEGVSLIRLFSVPQKEQLERGDLAHQMSVVRNNPDDWLTFLRYCELDAMLGYLIWQKYAGHLTPLEYDFNTITMEMNATGWPVDMDSVREMQRRYLENVAKLEENFRLNCDAEKLNLNSYPQQKAWCAERGIKANSFDEKNVAKMITKITDKIQNGSGLTKDKANGYHEVLDFLEVKQALGGSALKKLQVIIDTVGEDGRLRDQYIHCGAGQTLRTTGRSVQMQNLPRLVNQLEMDRLQGDIYDWTNTDLANNLRQVFTSSHKDGQLLVGDFASVESRGLAWLAGEQWKLDAYRDGIGVYELQASKMYGTPYDLVTKQERTTGKVGELSCGYGAGGGAVQSFGEGMGITMTEDEAAKLVYDWRDANPMTVAFWHRLDEMLRQALAGIPQVSLLPDGFLLQFRAVQTPASLAKEAPGAQSIRVWVVGPDSAVFMSRFFHGCYTSGGNVRYHRPSDRKTGDLWKKGFIDPKTKQFRHYELYGGKLAGILTQSFCRELFMRSMVKVSQWCDNVMPVTLIGQFHDELVVDYVPAHASNVTEIVMGFEMAMSDPGLAKSFPLKAEVKHDYRYIK